MEKNDFEKSLLIEDDLMQAVRETINSAINKLLTGMMQKKADEGTLTAKIKFKIEPDVANGRDVAKLNFDYKVTNVIPLKEQFGASQENEDDELVWVDGKWILMPITGGPQRTLLDDED